MPADGEKRRDRAVRPNQGPDIPLKNVPASSPGAGGSSRLEASPSAAARRLRSVRIVVATLDWETHADLQDSAKASGKAPFSPGRTNDAFRAYLRQATLTECGRGQAGRLFDASREMLGVTEAGRQGHT